MIGMTEQESNLTKVQPNIWCQSNTLPKVGDQ